ncbi:MAG: cation transporter dimerization domain-containing protein [Patescibacteria group bacterium]
MLDVALEKNEVDEIIKIIENNPEVNSFHYLKTRRSGNEKFVDVHLVFTPFIELLYAHNEADKIIAEIKKVDTDSTWHVNIHMDPYDDSAEHQQACNLNVR